MKVSTEIDNNFGYEKITQLVDNIPLRKDKYSKQACYTFKFHPEIKIVLKLGCQQTTCITNKTRDAIKKKISLTNEIEN